MKKSRLLDKIQRIVFRIKKTCRVTMELFAPMKATALSTAVKKTAGMCLLGSTVAYSSLSSAGFVYSQNFESLDRNVTTALADDGWLVGANVFDSGGGFLYNYFGFPAPNVENCTGPGFSCILSTAISSGLDGPNTGAQWLNTYNDYNNADHLNGSNNLIEAHTYRELGIIDASDVGTIVSATFDARLFNITGDTTAAVLLNVIKTSDSSFGLLGQSTLDILGGSVNTSGWTEDLNFNLVIDTAWVGELLTLNFISVAHDNQASGVFYDNINVSSVPVPAAVWLFGSGLLGLIGISRRKKAS